MPSKTQPRQHPTPKTVNEKALSPRASLSFRDKIRPGIPSRPPRPDGKRHQEKTGNKKEELVKNMSSLPGFLQRAENPQDKILNFGVLDWERLEKWKHKQKRSSGQSRPGASHAGSSSYNATSIASGTSKTEALPRQNYASCSEVYSSEQVNTPSGFLHHSSRGTSRHEFTAIEKCQRREIRRDKSYDVGTQKKKSHKSKASDSYQRECSEMGKPSSKLSTHEKTVEKCNDPGHQHHHKKQDRVILLVPKDFSQSGGLDEFQSTSVDKNSAELSWSSFSDVFSIGELHFEESTSDIPQSCPLPFMAETETELDMNLDRLIDDQRMHLPSDHPKLSADRDHKLSVSFEVQNDGNMKEELTCSAASTTSNGVDRRNSNLNNSNAKDPSLARQISSSIGRLSRSLSFREGSSLPQLKHVSTRSGPTPAQVLNFHDNSTDNAVNAIDRGIISPFRKLLHPLLKPRVAKPANNSLSHMENLSTKGLNDGQAIKSEEFGSTVIKAVLELTLRSGLPLFRFLVETNNEILASTVKRLIPLGKNDPSWLYSFYSVQEAKRKAGGWRHPGSKGNTSEFSYNVVGQMKVVEPLPCEKEDGLEEECTSESVLYGVDLTKVGEEVSESVANRELGAIVMKIPTEVSGDDQKKNTAEIVIPKGSIEVILPSAAHSLPNEGVPASLIHRWRSGGVCDCGGWDVGCKLQVLTNRDQEDKLLRTPPSAYHCNLFLQGAGEENRHVFRLVEHGEGIYFIEYDSAISSLQAFAISVAVLSNQKQPNLCDASGYGGAKKGHYRSKSCIVQGEGTRYATYPPHSPVSRA